jgi:hypothetical protein
MKSKYAVIGTLFVLAASVSADRERHRGSSSADGRGAPSVPRLVATIGTARLALRKNLTLF